MRLPVIEAIATSYPSLVGNVASLNASFDSTTSSDCTPAITTLQIMNLASTRLS